MTIASTPEKEPFLDLTFKSGMMAVFVVICGATIGFITYLISQVFYFPFVFPIGMAILGLWILRIINNIFKIKNRNIVLMCAVLMAISIYGTLHVSRNNYLWSQLVDQTNQIAVSENKPISPSQTEALINLVLKEETGQTGFLGLLALRAQSGLGFSVFTYQLSGAPINFSFNGVLVYVYWLIEFAIILSICVGRGTSQKYGVIAKEKPKCVVCGKKYIRESLGSVPQPFVDQFTELMKTENFQQAGKLILSYAFGDVKYPHLEIELEYCDNCHQSPSTLRAAWEQTAKARPAQRQQVIEQILTPEEHKILTQVMPKPQTTA